MYEILTSSKKSIFSEAALKETTYVAMALTKFPLLCFVNEPIAHFSSSLVRSSIQLLPDILQESMNIPPNIGNAYRKMSPYVLDVNDLKLEGLGQAIPVQKLIPNDGDGLVELQVEGQLPEDAIHHRIFAVDAPELYCTAFTNSENGHTTKRRNGHLSHLAVHFYLNSFSGPNATGTIRREFPTNGEPKDKYNRTVSSFWFVWLSSPNEVELLMIDTIQRLMENHNASCRVMSNMNPRAATANSPFLLNLNALLVLSGFCHVYTRFSPDASLLQLQAIAKQHKLGCIWSDFNKTNIVLGANQPDNSTAPINIQNGLGFPLKLHLPGTQPIRLQPWHERQCKRQLEYATRTIYRHHQKQMSELPYGFVIDMQSESGSQGCKYKTIQTGEQYLQPRTSDVVGIGGASTGIGLFTMKDIGMGHWITSYAPLAPVRPGHSQSTSDYIIKTTRDGVEVEIDGNLCPLGLGRRIQDGTFPFFLANEKFSKLVKHRVNCEWAVRNGQIWFKATQKILAGEELLTKYSHDNSYWTSIFSSQQQHELRQALLRVKHGHLQEAETILKGFKFTC